jgi:ATP-dependent Clp protease protease subunit
LGPEDFVRSKLLERRTVFVRGVLDDQLAGHAAAELMTLDATGDEAVTLYVDATGPSLDAAFTLMDVIDLLGVPVNGVCVGRAEEAAVGVLAVCAHRAAGANARVRLRDPALSVSGTGADMAGWVEHHQARLRRFHQRLAEATGRPLDEVAGDCARGRHLDARQAQAYGLVDEVVGRQPATLRPVE